MQRCIVEKVSQHLSRPFRSITTASLVLMLTYRRLLELQIVSALYHRSIASIADM